MKLLRIEVSAKCIKTDICSVNILETKQKHTEALLEYQL